MTWQLSFHGRGKQTKKSGLLNFEEENIFPLNGETANGVNGERWSASL
jgi:hypothetical protein